MCLNPTIAFILKVNWRVYDSDGHPLTKNVKFSGNVRKLYRDHHLDDNMFLDCMYKHKKGLWREFGYDDEHYDFILVPCRKCSECLKARSFMWSVRNIIENKYSSSSVFVTLTYDNNNIKFSNKFNIPTLCKKDVQLFIRSVRDYFRYTYKDDGIRFYMAGEYGTKTFRPHYHLIFYNMDPDKLKLKYWSRSGKDIILYRSEVIEKFWKFGYSTVQLNNDYSIRYCSGYVNKKMIPWYTAEKFKDDNFQPEFNNMSRMPGIGYQDFDKYKDMKLNNINNEYCIKYGDEIKKVRQLPFYDKKLALCELEDGYTYSDKVKEIMQPYFDKYSQLLENTDKNLCEYWEQEDEIFFNKVKHTRNALL